MDVLSGLLNGFQTALSFQNLYLCFIGCLWGTMVGVLPGNRPPGGDHPAHPGDLRPQPDRRHHHAGRDLLRRHVRRLDHLGPDERPGRIGVRRHLHRRVSDDPQGQGRGRPVHQRLGLLDRGHAEHRRADVPGADAGQFRDEVRPSRDVRRPPGCLHPPGIAGQRLLLQDHAHGFSGPDDRHDRNGPPDRVDAVHPRHPGAL